MTDTDERTYTLDEAAAIIEAVLFGPHDPAGDDILWAFVADEYRLADWDTKCQRFGAAVADAARRRQDAESWLTSRRAVSNA